MYTQPLAAMYMSIKYLSLYIQLEHLKYKRFMIAVSQPLVSIYVI